MNRDPDDEDLRRVLRGGGALPDDGFTDRVLARLPPPRRAAPRGRVLAASSALALAVLWLTPASPWLGRTLARLAASGSLPLSAVVASLALMAATLGATAYAARPS
jgi:hypothetical protein